MGPSSARVGWAVLLRGMRYRAGRSALVALLAAVAVAAAVLAPGFGRAAQQSVLTDGLAAAPAAAAGLTVTATGTASAAPAAHQPTGDARAAVDAVLAAPLTRVLAEVLADPIAGVDTDTQVTGGTEPLAARLAWRSGACEQLVVTGECPAGAGEVLVSERAAGEYGIAAGDPLTVDGREVTVVGSYVPRDPTAPYWGRTVYFVHGGFDPTSGAPRVDALFTGAEADVVADPEAVVRLGLTYPLRPAAVRLDQVAALRQPPPAVPELAVATELPAILDRVAADQKAIGETAPVVAVPLVLLATFVLFLLVAVLTEQRGQEIALAKLRGFPAGRAARFGLGEVLLLIVAAAPVGVALGLAAVAGAARLALTGGTHAELRWPVVAAAAAALAVTALAVLLAERATLRRDVLDLLRRVPQRRRWRAGVTEGVVVALAAASLVAAAGDRSAPLAMLAPALLAVVAGVAAARLVRRWAGYHLRRSSRAGPESRRRADGVPGLLAAARLSRRPDGQRVIVVVTVAVALLVFGTTAWQAAAQARRDHATDAVGADRVYTVLADHPTALRGAVDAADPAGTAMAVVRTREQYAGEPVELLAVEAARLGRVAAWRGTDPAAVAAALRPREPAPLRLVDQVEVTAQVRELGAPAVRLTALVSAPGGPPQPVSLGELAAGTARYRAQLPQCAAAGCRLLGLRLARTGAAGPFTATVQITAIHSGDSELPARLDDPQAWPGATDANSAGLTIVVDGGNPGDVVVEYQDTVPALPAVLAGPAPAEDPHAQDFSFLGLAERPEPVTIVDRVARLPRAGERGLLFDLEYAVHSAERSVALADSAGLSYEVWASAAAPADLPQRLAASGVPVVRTESMAGTLDQLGRRAPALGLWLYLLAAVAAVALALGVVALYWLEPRRAERAALRMSGVGVRTLRAALRREYAVLLGAPLLAGLAAGVAAAVLMLPGIPLVETGLVLVALPRLRRDGS